jgi:hypothetical protein
MHLRAGRARRRSPTALRAVVVALVGAVLTVSACTTTSGQPAPSTSPLPTRHLVVRPPASGAYFGAFVRPDGSRRNAVTRFERLIGRTLDIDHVYYHWDDSFPTADDRWDIQNKRIVFVSWQSETRAGVKIPWADIAAGRQDSVIDARARAVKALGVPILLCFEHEPGALVGREGSAADYVAAWRHVVARFAQDGVTNVSWVWTMTSFSFRAHKNGAAVGRTSPDALYPGDDVIDWISADGYNYAGCPGKNVPWRSFAQVFGPWYQWAERRGKPLMIAEFGLSEDPAVPGRKGSWFEQAAGQLGSFPLIKALVYFESTPRCDNLVTSSPSALAGFRRLVGMRYLHPPVPSGR